MAKKMTKERYEQNVKNIYGDMYSISEFIDMNTKIIVTCNKCNCKYEILPNEFTRNKEKNRKRFINGCNYCTSLLKDKELRNSVSEVTNNKISVIEKDIICNTHDIIDMECTVCGNKFKQSIHVLKNNIKDVKDKEKSYGCSICSKKKKKTTEMFIKEVYDLVGNEYSVVGQYINTDAYIEIKHVTCGNIYSVRPNDFINGNNRCPKCTMNSSNAVKFIEQYFLDNNISFKQEKKFSDCKHKKLLPFDFYLPEFNLLIEYDGEQHFKQIFKNTDYLIQHKRDKIKNHYCIDKGINLLRIKYNVSIPKIKNLLEKLFSEEGLTNFEYKKYNLYVIDIEDDIIYNEKTYYKEFYL